MPIKYSDNQVKFTSETIYSFVKTPNYSDSSIKNSVGHSTPIPFI